MPGSQTSPGYLAGMTGQIFFFEEHSRRRAALSFMLAARLLCRRFLGSWAVSVLAIVATNRSAQPLVCREKRQACENYFPLHFHAVTANLQTCVQQTGRLPRAEILYYKTTARHVHPFSIGLLAHLPDD